MTLLTEFDLFLHAEGNFYRSYEKMGAHVTEVDGKPGVNFAVWAPNAEFVSVIGEFNGWDRETHPLSWKGDAGVWEGFLPEAAIGQLYKYFIRSRHDGFEVEKADPYGFAAEIRPQTASKVFDIGKYKWNDSDWMEKRSEKNSHTAPISVYEVHLGSWRRNPDEGNRWLTYRELADSLVEYVSEMGYTHVEFLPVNEHPFDGSWGYQTVGYFAPTSRFGTPDDFMYLIDKFHQADIGVILDWVPAHFPKDAHGLAFFDGTHLYEHADPRMGEHPDWGTLVFNYGRNEVSNFLISNALFWLDKYHIDGLRVDAVASMLYLDYSRREGEWQPNPHGGRENLEAVAFLRRFNETVYKENPSALTTAEESTAWPMVSRPTYLGGLGFGMKWDMGWMHDTLDYFSKEPIYRKYHHNKLTFRQMYAFSENYMLSLSHDEVVHMKKSFLGKMPGDTWQKFANLRLLFGYQFAQPGKKLSFMGGEFGQWAEWDHDSSLAWHLLDDPSHKGLQRWVRDLNTFYRGTVAVQNDFHYDGFAWIDANDTEQSVLSFLRKNEDQTALFVFNFTPVPRPNYRLGVPSGGDWKEALNSDAEIYGGSGQGNLGGVTSAPLKWHGMSNLIHVNLPPLGLLVMVPSSSDQ